jgi:hypothetical protein
MARKKSSKDHDRLRELIEEATVDCYGEGEEWQGFVCMLEENVACPFSAKVLGEPVEVTALQGSSLAFGVKAVCRFKEKEYPIDITSLEWTKQRPSGFEWIEAYLEWLNSLG